MKCSDRGKISELGKKKLEEQPLSNFEKRLKKLIDYSYTMKDANLQNAFGFITADYISDKAALPLSVYRLRKTVDDIKAKAGSKIDELVKQLKDCIANIEIKQLKKIASAHGKPVFRRVY